MIWPWVLLTFGGICGMVFPYLVYPLLLGLRPRRAALPKNPAPAEWPAVSVILTAYNAANRIGEKIGELLALEYPGRLEIVVVDDGSDDHTGELATRAGAHQVLQLNERKGKSAAQNAGAAKAEGEILVFTDVAVSVRRDALVPLVKELLAPGVGCVTGVDESMAAPGQDANRGAGVYTRWEIKLRNLEAATGTLLGVNGCWYAIRAAHRPLVPASCVDDLYVPLAVVDRGLRVAFAPQAVAEVRRTAGLGEEFRRRVRTFAGGMFTLLDVQHDLPRAVRKLRWRLWGHKWLRWLSPLFAILALYGSYGLSLRWPWTWFLFVAQVAAWLTVLLGVSLSAVRVPLPRLLRLAMFLGLIQVAMAVAWLRVLMNRPYVTWEPTRRLW